MEQTGPKGDSPPTYVDAEQTSHAVQVVLIAGHGQDLGDDGALSPLDAELLNQLLQIIGSCLADGVYVIDQPCHAQSIELLIKELDAKLAGKKGHVLDDGQTHPPLKETNKSSTTGTNRHDETTVPLNLQPAQRWPAVETATIAECQ